MVRGIVITKDGLKWRISSIVYQKLGYLCLHLLRDTHNFFVVTVRNAPESIVKRTMKEIEFTGKIFVIIVFSMVKDDYF